jgi:hypothetical protein
MSSLTENGSLSEGELDTLEQDENFLEYLEKSGKTMLEFTYANYSEKYAIISGFYA